MRLETRACLDDLLRAGELIQSALLGVPLEQFLANWEKQSAIERQFMIIGEALIRIRDHDPAVFEVIPDSRAIISFRNLLVHRYDFEDPEAIYDLSGSDQSALIDVVTRLLSGS